MKGERLLDHAPSGRRRCDSETELQDRRQVWRQACGSDVRHSTAVHYTGTGGGRGEMAEILAIYYKI